MYKYSRITMPTRASYPLDVRQWCLKQLPRGRAPTDPTFSTLTTPQPLGIRLLHNRGSYLPTSSSLANSSSSSPPASLFTSNHRPALPIPNITRTFSLHNFHTIMSLSPAPRSTTSDTSSPPQPYYPRDTDPLLPLFSLKNKTAIVSGAGGGIGLAVAEAYAEAGANVIIWYHSNPKAHDRAAEIAKKHNVKCLAYKVDVTDPDSILSAVKHQVETDFGGRLDIFVANAGIPWTAGPILDVKDPKDAIAMYKKVIATDLDSVFYSALAVGPIFRSQGTGSFIATASMSGHIVNIPQSQAAYNAAKAGVIHLCRSLAVEWKGFARVNSVSPGYILTEISGFIPDEYKKEWHKLTPMGREGLAGELRGVYLWLASQASSYTTGTDVRVDGGYCLP